MSKDNRETAVSVIGRLAVRIILLAVSVLVLFTAARYAFDAGKDIFYQPPVEDAPGTDVTVEIPEGADHSSLAALLKQKGVIRNETAVAVQAGLYKTELYPGTYTLNTSMTAKEILTSVNEQAIALKEAAEAEQKEEESILGGGNEN